MFAFLSSAIAAGQTPQYPSTAVVVLEDERGFQEDWAAGAALAADLADSPPYYRLKKATPTSATLHGVVAMGDVLLAPKLAETDPPEASGISLTENTVMRGYTAALSGGGRPAHLWMQATEREESPTNAFVTDAWTVISYTDGRASRIWQHQDLTVTLHGDTSIATQLAIIDLEWSGREVERYTVRLYAADQLQRTVYERSP